MLFDSLSYPVHMSLFALRLPPFAFLLKANSRNPNSTIKNWVRFEKKSFGGVGLFALKSQSDRLPEPLSPGFKATEIQTFGMISI